MLESHLARAKDSFIILNSELTVVDILYFFEIRTIVELDKDLEKVVLSPERMPSVSQWYKNVTSKLKVKNLMGGDSSTIQFNKTYKSFEEKINLLK